MRLSIGFIFYLVIELFCHSNLFAQDQNLIKRSEIAETNEHPEIKFGVMLPRSYNSDKTYPVIYYLHGINWSYADWKADNLAEFITSHSLNGDIPECIMVFPDGKEGFWCDHYDGDPLLEKEVIEFLIPFIDQNYAVDVTQRLIMGWSSGGGGAMYFFSKYPKLFKAVISLDGPLISWDEFVTFQGERPKIIKNEDYYYEHLSSNRWIVRNKDMIKEKNDTTIFLAASFFAASHQNFLSILKEQGIPFKYKELNCNHEFGCVFSQTSNDILYFLSNTLQ